MRDDLCQLAWLAQDAADQAQNLGQVIVVSVGIGLLVLGAIGLIWYRMRIRDEQRAFAEISRIPGMKSVQGEQKLREAAETLGDIFREQSMYSRVLTVAGAYRTQRDGLDVLVAHTVLGFEPSNDNHQTMDKVVVVTEGFDGKLPQFLLMPNNFMLRQLHKDKVFQPTDRFGKNNLVRGEDQRWVEHVIGPVARETLGDNRELVIESRRNRMAFYLHTDKVMPADFEKFLDRCVRISREVNVRAAEHAPLPGDEAQQRVINPME